MATYARALLSGSTDGRGVKVVATTSPGTTIHTHPGGSVIDEIWLSAYNSDTAPVILTIQWGGTTSPDDDIIVSIPSQTGLTLVVDGKVLQNSLVVKAYAAAANKIVIHGYVNRITP